MSDTYEEINFVTIGTIEWGRRRGNYVVSVDPSKVSERFRDLAQRTVGEEVERYLESNPDWEENKIPLECTEAIFLKLDDRTLSWGQFQFHAKLPEEVVVAWKVRQEGTGIGAWSSKRMILCLKSEVEKLHAEALDVMAHEGEVLHPHAKALKALINQG